MILVDRTEACVLPVDWSLACAWVDGKIKTEDLLWHAKEPWALCPSIQSGLRFAPFAIYVLRLGNGKRGMFDMLNQVGWLMQFSDSWQGIVWYAHTKEVFAWGKEFGKVGCTVYENGVEAGKRFWCGTDETRFTQLARKVFLTRLHR